MTFKRWALSAMMWFSGMGVVLLLAAVYDQPIVPAVYGFGTSIGWLWRSYVAWNEQ